MARHAPTKSRLPQTKVAASQVEKLRPVEDAVQYIERYARQRPTEVALWCLAVGFVLGWRLKPW